MPSPSRYLAGVKARQDALKAQGLCQSCGKHPVTLSRRTGRPSVRCVKCNAKNCQRMTPTRTPNAITVRTEAPHDPAQTSWWIGLSRDEFTARLAEESARMARNGKRFTMPTSTDGVCA